MPNKNSVLQMAVALKQGKMKKAEIPNGVIKRVTQIAADMTPSELSAYTSTPDQTPPPKGRQTHYRNVRSS